ncbi:MAG: DUF4340 domain-containing protein [Candidatus Tectomicrobia bacterium]|uniref:DUF4340 domain-containing protein n=1 Tax=Tectimicrobiota bacterium TaxID=2528274 RepID=A0A932FVQ9_UNCTE|nr:DUF4340 domain-containing protein [Candidatus Tectomicrobia bacterium]
MIHWRKIFLLLAVLLGLGGYFYFYELRGKEAQKAREEAAKKLFSLKREEIQEIRLRTEKQGITCRKTGGRWELVSPVKAPADPAEIESLLSSLTDLTSERTVEEKPKDLAAYGLQPPQGEVVLKGSRGEQVLRVGSQSPLDSFFYVQKRGNPGVLLASSALQDSLNKGSFDLRDKTVVALSPKEVQKVELAREGLSLTCQRRAGDRWDLVAPLRYRADGEKIQDALEKLRALRVKQFVDEQPQDLARYGLDAPQGRLVLWKEDAKGKSTSQVLRWARQPEGTLYAQRQGAPQVFALDEDFLKALPATVDDWRDPHPFQVAAEEKVERLELGYPEERVVCAREKEDRWRLQSPIQAAASPPEVEALLGKLRALKVQRFVTDTPARLADFGLERPARYVRVWQKGQTLPQTLWLGQEIPEGVYGRIEPGSTVFLLASPEVGALSKRAIDLRDRSFLSFEPSEIGKVALQYPTTRLLLEREGKEAWRLVEPQKQKARHTRVLDLLWEINGLRFKEILTEKGGQESQYGLDRPGITITLWKSSGALVDTLLLGAKDPSKGLVYAKTGSKATVYAVEDKFLIRLPKAAADVAEEKK